MKRSIGLDLMRAVAIIFVLIDHGWYFFRLPTNHVNTFAIFGYLGVEMFFVLSGFLIGQILLTDYIHDLSFSRLRHFYLRRWFRTLPLYYMLLVMFILASGFIYRQSNLHPYHFIFLQNFFPKEIEFFGIAWSLSVEEWFYLVLPFLFVIFTRIVSRHKDLLRLIAMAIFAVLISRFLYAYIFTAPFETVRKSIFFRFDSLLVGVALATTKRYFSSQYAVLRQGFTVVFSLFFIACFSFYYMYLSMNHILDSSLIIKTFGMTGLSISLAGLIPFLEQSRFLRTGELLTVIITKISVISYSMYLLHLEIFTVFIVLLGAHLNPYLLFLGACISTFLVSHVVYKYVEAPCMNLREKYAPR